MKDKGFKRPVWNIKGIDYGRRIARIGYGPKVIFEVMVLAEQESPEQDALTVDLAASLVVESLRLKQRFDRNAMRAALVATDDHGASVGMDEAENEKLGEFMDYILRRGIALIEDGHLPWDGKVPEVISEDEDAATIPSPPQSLEEN